jgi:hypothetical protein
MKPLQLQTISAAPGALAWVRAGRPARVLHVFAAVCNLISDRDDLLSLILEPGQMDPFTLLLKQPPSFAGFIEHLNAESSVTSGSGRIRIDGLEVVIDKPLAWISRPDWDALRVALSGNPGWIDLVEGEVIRSRSAESLAALIGNPGAAWRGSRPPWWGKAAGPIQSLLEGVASRDERALSRGACRLAGFGPGLTPSGDDFLIGLMYAARILLEPGEADAICETIVRASVPRTGLFPAAHLTAASRGEASGHWHALLAACLEGEDEGIRSALSRLLAVGHTSGEDAVSGFLLGLRHAQEPSDHDSFT